MTEYLALARSIVARATASQAGLEVEALIMSGSETEILVQSGAVEKLSQSGSRGLGVRAILRDADGGRVGYAYTSNLSDTSVDETWRMAAALAQIATPDPYRSLPDPQSSAADDLEIFDPAFAALPIEQKIDFLKRVEAAALAADPRILTTQNCSYQDGVTHVDLANSRGFAGSYSRTFAASYLYAVAKGDDGGMTSGIGIGVSNYFADLDADTIGREAANNALDILSGELMPTGRGTVVFAPFVAAEILTYLAFALSAQSMQRGRSFLAGKVGQEIGSDKVTLLDNGRMPRGLASAPFDGEGVPTGATKLVDEGILQRVIYDTYTARRASSDATPVGSTGNAGRSSYRSLPSLSPSNFYLQPGDQTPDEIIAAVAHGLYVTNIMQTGGINPVTGDCSMGANGVLIENGKLTRPISGVTVATTLDDLLKHISAVGTDLRFVPLAGSIGSPTIRVDNVMIGGA
ncbi:MAG: TldD/PmbA family protein [Chloroflexota bacterium]|nr:TldD/PmbA family protein [Chloroflexota bacterium]